jgi:hypothetical protein
MNFCKKLLKNRKKAVLQFYRFAVYLNFSIALFLGKIIVLLAEYLKRYFEVN